MSSFLHKIINNKMQKYIMDDIIFNKNVYSCETRNVNRIRLPQMRKLSQTLAYCIEDCKYIMRCLKLRRMKLK